ncbi:histidinol-phosphate transaminase [Pampinifervens florentissimum]|uniref:histidinol-phosphate transaminase n=1 Tax=Pampinifervens florentissimum TaxID=1632019 RepID=UPI0013B48EF4|nr:histidinol-phosphate transaminase [Hydrogenobacter sp. T-8]QID33367.1 histidinol-phosphate transaminase [Hydrogenobacter sp. T-8]
MISKRVRELAPYKTETTEAKVRLSSNELSLQLPEDVKKRIGEEVSRIPFNRYPDPEARELKEVIALRFGVKPENIVLGNGSDELIYYLSIAVGEFSSGVFCPVPTFSMYSISAQVLGRERIEVRLNEEFDIDLQKSLEVIRKKKPALAYFAYPNNPTGNCFSEEGIRAIRNQGVFTIVDEAYYHYSGKTFLKEALEREDTVVLRTLSKIGMAGLRVGILIGKEEVVKEINKIRLPFNITYPSQVIAVLILRDFYHIIEEAIQTVISERQRVYKEMLKMEGIRVYPSEANFIFFKSLYLSGDELYKRLLRKGVLVRNFSYMVANCLRVSIGEREENDAFLQALHEVLTTS